MKEREPSRKPPDLASILEKALTEKSGLEMQFANQEKAISPSDIEEAMRYAPLRKDGIPLEAEGVVILDESQRPALTLPGAELVEALHAEDNRIEAFDVASLKLDGQNKFSRGANLDAAYYAGVSTPLASRILKDFPGKKTLRARGIAASINGALYDGRRLLVRDIRQILRIGDEKGDESTLMASIGRDDQDVAHIHDRLNQYLISGQDSLRRRFPPEVGKSVFPVLLVYDESKVKFVAGYAHMLPTDPAERARCILKAYIFPRPA